MRQRTKRIEVRLTEEEYNILENKVAESGLNRTDFLVACIAEKLIVNIPEMKDILRQLSGMANNINQIAKTYNQKGEVLPEWLKDTDELRSKTWQLLRQLKTMGKQPRA